MISKEYNTGNFYLNYNEYINTSSYTDIINNYKNINIENKHIILYKKILEKINKPKYINIGYLIDIIKNILTNYHIKCLKSFDKILITQLIISSLVDNCHYENLYDLVEVKNFIKYYSYNLIKNYNILLKGELYDKTLIKYESFIDAFEKHLLYKRLNNILSQFLKKKKIDYNNIIKASFILFNKIDNIYFNLNQKINIISYIIIRYIIRKNKCININNNIEFIKYTLPLIITLQFKKKPNPFYILLKKIFCL